MITLFGHGYIGKAIGKYLDDIGQSFYWYGHNTQQIILGSVIINASGYTGKPNVDACETHKYECIDGNIIWPLKLETHHVHSPIIHISSGCVYNGYKNGGWTEEDPPNFTGSFYSLTKVIEQENINLKENYLLRIRMPFEKNDHPKNYLTKLKNYSKLIDAENSLSYVEDVVKVALFFAENLPEPGIYNVCNPGVVTTKQIVDMMGLKGKEWFTMDEFNSTVLAPRSFCTLNMDKLKKIYPMPSVEERLAYCIA